MLRECLGMDIEIETAGGEVAVEVGKDIIVTSTMKGRGIIIIQAGAAVLVLIITKTIREEDMMRATNTKQILYNSCQSASPAQHGSGPHRSPSLCRKSSRDGKLDEKNGNDQPPAQKDVSPGMKEGLHNLWWTY